jgi:hypothetical protein
MIHQIPQKTKRVTATVAVKHSENNLDVQSPAR